MFGRILEEVGDDRNLWPLGWRCGRCTRVDRSWRTCIDGWLGEHVVVEGDRHVIAAFRIARTPFF
jgi:hypothetical protein